VDLAPTFLGLAGLAKPPQMDGKSLAPLLLTPPPAAAPPADASEGGTREAQGRSTARDGAAGQGADAGAAEAQGGGGGGGEGGGESGGEGGGEGGGSVDARGGGGEFQSEQPPPVLAATAAHLRSLPGPRAYAASWRESVFIEYYYVQANVKVCLVGAGRGCAFLQGQYRPREGALAVLKVKVL
jgi:hypothetical protein